MQFHARTGTPSHLETKTYGSPGLAKSHLRTRINSRVEWAKRYNTETARQLLAIREQVDSLNLATIRVGEVRRWTATDDYTNVEFVFELEKEYE